MHTGETRFLETSKGMERSGNDEADPPEVSSKRVHVCYKSDTKRAKLSGQANVGTAEEASLLEAEINARRELYKIQLQAKRDEAICVRVKARKELLDLGVSVTDVDRLMPLWKSNAQVE